MTQPERRVGRALRVALAPDSPVVNAGTAALLRAHRPAMEVCDLTPGYDAWRVDVVLYDPQRFSPVDRPRPRPGDRAPVLIAFSWSIRADTVAQARAHGAAGFVSKEVDAEQLASAVHEIHAGTSPSYVVGPDTRALVVNRSSPEGLTQRELDMLELITQGFTNDQIARRLYLSINSVKTYIRSAYRKIGVTRRPQAVLWGVHHGFAPQQIETSVPEPSLR